MIYDDFMRQVDKLLEQIQKDDIGTQVGQEFVGGGGGLLSVETIHQANLVRLEKSRLAAGTHVHRKGGVYRLIGLGHLQTATPLPDMSLVAMYEAVKPESPDKRLWARAKEEFFDPTRFSTRL